MLYFRQALRRSDYTPQAIIVKFVRESAGRASSEDGSNGYHMILFFNILMDGIVCEAGERKASAGNENFYFVGRRQLLDAIEDVTGLALS